MLALRGADKYNPDKVPDLEQYVKEQVQNKTYNLDANLALLRHYSFYPRTTNVTAVSQILVKAMMQLPERDLSLCLHLIPDSIKEDRALPLASVIVLGKHLEEGRFLAFWEQTGYSRDLLNDVPGFYDAIRNYIITSLQNTYQKISRQTFAHSVRLDGATLDQLVQAKVENAGWQLVEGASGTVIFFPKNGVNSFTEHVASDNIKLEQLAPLIAAATARAAS